MKIFVFIFIFNRVTRFVWLEKSQNQVGNSKRDFEMAMIINSQLSGCVFQLKRHKELENNIHDDDVCQSEKKELEHQELKRKLPWME